MADENISPDAGAEQPKSSMFLIMAAGVFVLAVGTGITAAKLVGGSGGSNADPLADISNSSTEKYQYYNFDLVTVNLNDPRLTRFIQVKLMLGIHPDYYDAAKERIEEKKPELTSWLITYLADCDLDDVRGKKNHNKILREVQDEFNHMLWPDSKGLIANVTHSEWTIQ